MLCGQDAYSIAKRLVNLGYAVSISLIMTCVKLIYVLAHLLSAEIMERAHIIAFQKYSETLDSIRIGLVVDILANKMFDSLMNVVTYSAIRAMTIRVDR